jgi:glucosamine--fructose-6-phosphate aminotransferase (isomerizing)
VSHKRNSKNKVIESTLEFQFEERDLENSRDHPTYYRSLKREPRQSHPFTIYEDIQRQPELIARTLQELDGRVQQLAEEMVQRDIRRVVLSGVGSSFHVGASAAHAFWRLAGLPAEFVQSAEAVFAEQVFDYDRTLVIGLSASGNTVETVQHLQATRAAGAHTLACANLDHTRLTAVAHDRLVIPGGYGFVWDFSTRLAVLILLAMEIGRIKAGDHTDGSAVRAGLYSIPEVMKGLLADIDRRCMHLGKELSDCRSILLPTTGNQLPNSWEIALRFEEMAHIPARGYSVVDFLHGSIGLLSPQIATLLLAPLGAQNDLMWRAAQVTRVVKTPCFAILDEDDQSGVAQIVDGIVRVPVVHPILKPFVYLLPGQLIAYYAEAQRPGGNPDVQRTDQPRYARAFDIAMPPKSH